MKEHVFYIGEIAGCFNHRDRQLPRHLSSISDLFDTWLHIRINDSGVFLMTRTNLIDDLTAEDRGAFELKWDEVISEVGSLPFSKHLLPTLKSLCLNTFAYAINYERAQNQ